MKKRNLTRLLLFTILFLSSCSQNTKSIVKTKKDVIIVTKKKGISHCQKKIKHYFKLIKLASDSVKRLNMLSLNHHQSYKNLCKNYPDKILGLINKHDNKIGILIEDKNTIKTKSIISGLKNSTKIIRSKKSTNFLIIKSKNTKRAIRSSLAKLIIEKKVSIIISWGDDSFLNYVKKWQEKLDFPFIFIDSNLNKNKYAFAISPNALNYGKTLAKDMLNKGIRKIAILSPDKYTNSSFIQSLKKTFLKHGIEIVFAEDYKTNDFESMDMACRNIFVIDREKRKDDYQDKYNLEEKMAHEKGYVLNKKLVFLSAKVTFDAVFIPDNFKAVRHFIKLFQYYNAKDLKLFGTHEWRSEELLSSYEPYLDGAFFVDFIGNYNKLPLFYKLKNKNNVPSLFLKNGKSYQIDYKIMGHYAGIVAQIGSLKSENRSQLSKILDNLVIKDTFLGRRQVFKKQVFNWPSFLFDIHSNNIYLGSKKL